jgi:hypothetical protein
MAGFKFKERVERPVERFDRNFDPDKRIGRNSNTNTTTTNFDPDKRIPFDPDKQAGEY